MITLRQMKQPCKFLMKLAAAIKQNLIFGATVEVEYILALFMNTRRHEEAITPKNSCLDLKVFYNLTHTPATTLRIKIMTSSGLAAWRMRGENLRILLKFPKLLMGWRMKLLNSLRRYIKLKKKCATVIYLRKIDSTCA